MEEKRPLVSIIVRTKDRPELLKTALKSISAQTYRPVEVVLVNDGGCDLNADELKGILEDVSLNYNRLEKNTGRANAANIGIENTKGKYVGFLDDDDIYYPYAIETLVNAALSNTNKVIYGKVVCKNYMNNSNIVNTNERMLGEAFDFGRLIFENFIPINSLLIPTDFVYKTGLFDNAFEIYEDWDWLIRLAEVSEFYFKETAVAEYTIYGTATITGKGGASMQNYYRGKLLAKHIKKANAEDFLSYLQSIIDRVVLEKDVKIHEFSSALLDKEMLLTNLTEEIRARDIEIRARDIEIRARDEGIKARGEEIKRLNIQAQELKKLVDDILSSESWKITKPFRIAGSVIRRIFSRAKTWRTYLRSI